LLRTTAYGPVLWVLPEISEEPNGGLTLQGNTESEKAVESRLEEGLEQIA
jgi:hypothetical protein